VALSEIAWRRVVREVVREELRQLGELVEAIATCPAELHMCRSDLDKCRADLAWCTERIRDVVPVATPPMSFATIVTLADVRAETGIGISVSATLADVRAETGIGISVSVETRVR
jgi:hypothetical protein